MASHELRAIMEADDKCSRLASLRDQLVGGLALIGGLLWLASVWPARFAILQRASFWLFGVGAVITLAVIGREIAWARRRDELMGLTKGR